MEFRKGMINLAGLSRKSLEEVEVEWNMPGRANMKVGGWIELEWRQKEVTNSTSGILGLYVLTRPHNQYLQSFMTPHFGGSCIGNCSLEVVVGGSGVGDCWMAALALADLYRVELTWVLILQLGLWIQSLIFITLPRGFGFTLPNLTEDFLINHKVDEWIDDERKAYIET